MKEWNLTTLEQTTVAEDLMADLPVFWTGDGWIYFGQLEEEPKGEDDYTCDVYRLNRRTHAAEQITTSGAVVGYTLDPVDDQIVFAEKRSGKEGVVVARAARDGGGCKDWFSIGYSDDMPLAVWQLSMAGGWTVVTTPQIEEGQWDLRLVGAGAPGQDGRLLHPGALRDRDGNPVRGRSPCFVAPGRLVFIGPLSSESVACRYPQPHFERESLFTYDFSTRTVTRLAVVGEWFSG